MTNPRSPANTEKPKLLDNLEQVAGELVNYLKEMQREQDLIQQIKSAGDEYNKPLKSWIWFPVYYWFRKRGPVINALILYIQQRGSAETVLDGIDQRFSFGGWESTSLNTYLMTEMVLALPGYSDTKENFSLRDDKYNRPIKALKKIFLTKTNNILRGSPDAEAVPSEATKEELLKRKSELEAELVQLTKVLCETPEVIAVQPEAEDAVLLQVRQQREAELQQMRQQRDIRQIGKDMAAASKNFLRKTKTKSLENVNKLNLNASHLQQLQTELDKIYQPDVVQQRLLIKNGTKPESILKKGVTKPESVVNQPAKGGVNMQLKVKKLNLDRIKELEKGLFGAFSSALQKIEAERVKAEKIVEDDTADLPASTFKVTREDLLDALITPPSTPQLSRAANEEPIVTLPYVAPPRRKLEMTDEQLRAMNRLFPAPSSDKKNEELPRSPTLSK